MGQVVEKSQEEKDREFEENVRSLKQSMNEMLPKEKPGVEYFFRKILNKKHFLHTKMAGTEKFLDWWSDDMDLRAQMYKEEMAKIKPLDKSLSDSEKNKIINDAKLKAITRYAEHIAPAVEQAEKEVLAQEEKDRVKTLAEKARRKSAMEKGLDNWNEFDLRRIAAFKELEQVHLKAIRVATEAYNNWPADKKLLPDGYIRVPASIRGIGEKAQTEGDILRTLRLEIVEQAQILEKENG